MTQDEVGVFLAHLGWPSVLLGGPRRKEAEGPRAPEGATFPCSSGLKAPSGLQENPQGCLTVLGIFLGQLQAVAEDSDPPGPLPGWPAA